MNSGEITDTSSVGSRRRPLIEQLRKKREEMSFDELLGEIFADKGARKGIIQNPIVSDNLPIWKIIQQNTGKPMQYDRQHGVYLREDKDGIERAIGELSILSEKELIQLFESARKDLQKLQDDLQTQQESASKLKANYRDRYPITTDHIGIDPETGGVIYQRITCNDRDSGYLGDGLRVHEIRYSGDEKGNITMDERGIIIEGEEPMMRNTFSQSSTYDKYAVEWRRDDKLFDEEGKCVFERQLQRDEKLVCAASETTVTNKLDGDCNYPGVGTSLFNCVYNNMPEGNTLYMILPQSSVGDLAKQDKMDDISYFATRHAVGHYCKENPDVVRELLYKTPKIRHNTTSRIAERQSEGLKVYAKQAGIFPEAGAR